MVLKYLLTIFVIKGHKIRISSIFQQKTHDLSVCSLLLKGHLTLQVAEIVEKRKAFFFIENPICVSSVLDQQSSYHQINLSLFKTKGILHHSQKSNCQRALILSIWFIGLSFCEEQKSNNFIISTKASCQQGSLLSVLGLQIDVYLSVLKQQFSDLRES